MKRLLLIILLGLLLFGCSSNSKSITSLSQNSTTIEQNLDEIQFTQNIYKWDETPNQVVSRCKIRFSNTPITVSYKILWDKTLKSDQIDRSVLNCCKKFLKEQLEEDKVSVTPEQLFVLEAFTQKDPLAFAQQYENQTISALNVTDDCEYILIDLAEAN